MAKAATGKIGAISGTPEFDTRVKRPLYGGLTRFILKLDLLIILALSLMQRRFHHKVTGFYGGNVWPDTFSYYARTPSAEAILTDDRKYALRALH